MTIGTSYFINLQAAYRYYAPYGDSHESVDRKIAEGQIHIGRPTAKAGERLTLIDGGTRWAEGGKMSGYILHETQKRVVIATMDSSNVKTGNMVQVWILARHTAPHIAVKTGDDAIVCGDCKHRGTSCYVVTFQGPRSVWAAYQRGAYVRLDDYSVFAGRMVRLGAYGDPAFIPQSIVRRIVSSSAGHTGYTHQWTRAPWLRPFVMASVDNLVELETARRGGWRTFRVDTGESGQTGEILCPASEQAGKRTTCERCGLCNGARDGVKSIFIPAHGRGAFKILQ